MGKDGKFLSRSVIVWALAIFAYFLSIIIAIILTPNAMTLTGYAIDRSQLTIIDGDTSENFSAFPDLQNTVPVSRQHFPRQKSIDRRIHAQFDEAWPVNGPRRLYIPSGGSEIEVWVNGIFLSQSEPVSLFAPGFGNSWLRTDIPRSVLTPGPNRLDIFIRRDDARSGVSDIYIGPRSEILRIEQQQQRWMRSMPGLHLSAGTLIIIISLLGLIYGPQKGTYLISGCLGSVMVIQASLSAVTMRPEFVETTLYMRFFLPFSILLLTLLLQIYDRLIWRGLNPIKVVLYGFALTGPILSLFCLVAPVSLPGHLLLATLSLFTPLPLLIIGLGLNIWHDLSQHRTRLEALSGTVSKQAEELDEKSEQINLALRNKAVMEERQRFTRDIHDGIGGQLLSLLLRVRTDRVSKEEIANELQAGLDDLRLVVDSLDHTGDNLSAAMTTFKARARNQLSAVDINLTWEQSDELDVEFPNPRGTLHVFRFMQEAVTNIVKHSGASQVLIAVTQSSTSDPMTIYLADNGTGFDPASPSGGRGMKNLKSRATQLGAELEFGEGIGGKGTGISLEIPNRPKRSI